MVDTSKRYFRLFLVVCSSFVVWLTLKSRGERQPGGGGGGDDEKEEVFDWLRRNSLAEYSAVFLEAGLTSLEMCASFELENHKSFNSLPPLQIEKIKNAIVVLKEEKHLEYWLIDQGLVVYLKRLCEESICNLTSLSRLSDEKLQDLTKDDTSLQDYISFKHGISKLKQGSQHNILDQIHYFSMKQRLLNIVGMILLATALATPIMLLNGSLRWLQLRPTHSTKTRIFDFFTGKYPAPQYCTVLWDWKEPQIVGNTMSFTIQFFQKNGKPYPVSNSDNILVEIMHLGVKVATTMELGSQEPERSNEARVSFTVHRAGDYQISVLVGARHIKGSPFIKTFEAGAIDASKTGFMNYSSTVVCTAGMSHPLTIETRDTFGNLTAYKADQQNYFKIKVRESGTNLKYVPATQIFYDPLSKRLTMHIKMEKEGCFQAVVTYGDIKLKNGEFNILVLSPEDTARVKKNLAKRSHNIWYEARLLSCNHDRLEKPKKVFVYMSPKQLTLKEFYFKIIGKKLFTYRVCPSTKFYFNGFNNQSETPVFTVDDGSQPPVVLAAKDRNIIAATFTNFLLKNIGGSETFQDKQAFFNHEIRQLHLRRAHDRHPIKIERSKILQTSYKTTKHCDLADWCRNFEIQFIGEEGLDWGGLRREWFELLCTELFDPNCSGLFLRFSDDSQGLVHPNPKRPPELKLKYYEFAGKIVGKCLYESALGGTYKQLVKARLSRSFLAQLIGLRVNYKYFESDDPELYKSKIRFIEEHDVDDMELTFSEEEYNEAGQLIRVVDLIPNGSKIAVNNKNKLWYLDLLAQHRLANSVRDEVESFLKGLNELIPDNLLSIFDENELELLMCGTGNYSITDFKLHHSICGSSPAFNKVLDWFWTIVTSFTEEQMARLLQFTTGCSQLPPGGFSELNPKFQITAAPTYNTLPTAHTCFNQLCLPDYDTIDKFHKALMIAINEGSQGFGMV